MAAPSQRQIIPYGISEKDLSDYFERAYSIESRAGHGKEHLELAYIGTVELRERLYLVYIDTELNPWYKVQILIDGACVDEYEAIFGRKEKPIYASKKRH